MLSALIHKFRKDFWLVPTGLMVGKQKDSLHGLILELSCQMYNTDETSAALSVYSCFAQSQCWVVDNSFSLHPNLFPMILSDDLK